MSDHEKRRAAVLHGVEAGDLTLEEATRMLGLSYRQTKRIWKRFREEGDEGLVHRNKGKPSNRAFLEQFKEEALRRYRDGWQGVGPTRFAGALAREGMVVDHETLRRWLLESGAWKVSRNRQTSRAPESRFRGFGEMLTLLSVHDLWLGAGLPPGFLVFIRDEATALALCSLATHESSDTAMRLLWTWTERHGIPAAMRGPQQFMDEETRLPALGRELDYGRSALSPLHRTCERLGIEANVLGRLEGKVALRELEPFMEALKSELRTAAATCPEEATALLLGSVGELLNSRFASRPSLEADYHVPVVDGTDLRPFFEVRPRSPDQVAV